jgi:hypothetical protein
MTLPFFLAILFDYLITDGLRVNAHPVRPPSHLHVHRGIQVPGTRAVRRWDSRRNRGIPASPELPSTTLEARVDVCYCDINCIGETTKNELVPAFGRCIASGYAFRAAWSSYRG